MSATVIGAQARVYGSIEIVEDGALAASGDLIVEGRIQGSVVATGIIHLLASARVHGDLEAARVVIDDGAIFEGQVRLRHCAQPARAPYSTRAPAPAPARSPMTATKPLPARMPAPRAQPQAAPRPQPQPERREVPALSTPGRQRVQRRSS